MQQGKNRQWVLVASFFVVNLFGAQHYGSGQKESKKDTTEKERTVNVDSLVRASALTERTLDSAEEKVKVIEAKINDNQKKAKEIDQLINELVKKASKPKIVVKRVVEKVPVYISIENSPAVNDSFYNGDGNYTGVDSTHSAKKETGLKRFFNKLFKRKK